LTSNKIRVVIADDNREFGDILYEYLNNQEDIEVVGVARDGIEAYELIVEKLPDIAILDIYHASFGRFGCFGENRRDCNQ